MGDQLYRIDSPAVARLRQYFGRENAAAKAPGAPLPPVPSREQLTRILEETFWASLRREEGRAIILSLAFVTPEWCEDPFTLASPLFFSADQLVRIAPAVERPGIHLGVAPEPDGMLEVWGHTHSIPHLAFVLEAAAPGILVVKHRRDDGYGKFVNVAVLNGTKAKFVRMEDGATLDLLKLFTQLLRAIDAERAPALEGIAQILVRLALSMRAHGHGGTLLVVPSEHEEWSESIGQPIKYRARPEFGELRAIEALSPERKKTMEYRDALTRAVDAVAGLTAVDGAVVITHRLGVVGFGAKIRKRPGGSISTGILVTEPVEDDTPRPLPIWAFGGTRHQSAAQFVHDQHDALALVSSQDGRFTVLTWSEERQIVVAHTATALVL
jgi:hypothetical protein